MEHTAHAYHQEKHRLRPAYDNRKRRFAAVQPADRKSYLIPIIIPISVFSFSVMHGSSSLEFMMMVFKGL